MTKKNVKLLIPSIYCPGNTNALEHVKHMTCIGLYRLVMEQSDEFYELSASDFNLLLEPNEATISAFMGEKELTKLNELKNKYNFLTRQQIMKILIIKKLRNGG